MKIIMMMGKERFYFRKHVLEYIYEKPSPYIHKPPQIIHEINGFELLEMPLHQQQSLENCGAMAMATSVSYYYRLLCNNNNNNMLAASYHDSLLSNLIEAGGAGYWTRWSLS